MTVRVPAREERGARSVVACPEQGARQPRGRDPPEPGAVPQLCPQGPPGSRADGSHPVPTRPGPSVTHPGWAGGLVPATATHQRRPTVSRTGKDSQVSRQDLPGREDGAGLVHRQLGTLGRVGEGPRDRQGRGLTASQKCNKPSGTWPQPRGQGPVALLLHVQPTPLPRPRRGPPAPPRSRSPDSGRRPWSVRGGLRCRCPPPRASAP